MCSLLGARIADLAVIAQPTLRRTNVALLASRSHVIRARGIWKFAAALRECHGMPSMPSRQFALSASANNCRQNNRSAAYSHRDAHIALRDGQHPFDICKKSLPANALQHLQPIQWASRRRLHGLDRCFRRIWQHFRTASDTFDWQTKSFLVQHIRSNRHFICVVWVVGQHFLKKNFKLLFIRFCVLVLRSFAASKFAWHTAQRWQQYPSIYLPISSDTQYCVGRRVRLTRHFGIRNISVQVSSTTVVWNFRISADYCYFFFYPNPDPALLQWAQQALWASASIAFCCITITWNLYRPAAARHRAAT